MDRNWVKLQDRLSYEYKQGVKTFIEVARRVVNENGKVRCPCRKCCNTIFHTLEVVKSHLCMRGIQTSYVRWIYHGEENRHNSERTQIEMGRTNTIEEEDDINDMIHDAFGPMDESNVEYEDNAEMHDHLKFAKLLTEAEKELFPGSKMSSLNFIIKLMHLKVLNQWSNKSIDMLLDLLNDAFDIGCHIPKNYYEVRKILKGLGLGYEIIHACKYDCALFWKENELLDKCPECDEPRYELFMQWFGNGAPPPPPSSGSGSIMSC